METNLDENKLIDYYNQGLSYREIQTYFNVHHTTISKRLRKLNLNSRYRQSIDIISEHEARCKKCREVKSINEFQFNRRNSIKEYRLAYCNSCRKKQSYLNLNKDLQSLLKNKLNRIKRFQLKNNINYNLDLEYILDLYNKQNGNCFYSIIPMQIVVGNGFQQNTISFDKVIPEKGYIKGNIVLCTTRFNTIKSNLTLQELEYYMPLIYKKLIECEWLTI